MSSSVQENNKRVAKNTLLLYIRMGFILIINLYTSRVILKYLGVQDFGIYNVVGGITAMVGVLNSAMTVATQRYLSFEIGRNDFGRLNRTFCISLSIYIILCIIFFIICETIGLWFLNTQLNIPPDRISAANWVYQFSIFAVINSLLTDPYNASIVSHERMDVFAYVSILDNTLKLLIVFCLPLIPLDRLVIYGALYLLVSLIITMIYRIYCIRNFKECHFRIYRDTKLFKEILSYSGWNLFGSVAGIAQGQGLNILLNMFFTPVVNAANGIAAQVNGAVGMFFSNFYIAVRPQITKYYAQDELQSMLKLVFRSSKYSYYLIWIVALPIIIEAPYIINLWLGQLPTYVVDFTRFTIFISAITAMSSPIMTMAHATGRIRTYQLVVGLCQILILPISYIYLANDFPPIIVFEVSLCMTLVAFFLRLYIVKILIPTFSIKEYMREVFVAVILVSMLSVILPYYMHYRLSVSLINTIFVCGAAVFSSIISIWLLGMTSNEKQFLINLVKDKIKAS
ncbi:lipopolysaccharide biosynthesis protein [Hallella colorans]|uniref:lipopolysaccharide biosynthesis protein n=1 Tax=Hallella colorans TaxID=1703337 RepID=UPI002889E6A7|nr:lipopolysaccharide biosynthesis protein [Hallella colorans]